MKYTIICILFFPLSLYTSDRDLTFITAHNAQVSKQKWEARKNYKSYQPESEAEDEDEQPKGNPIRGVPNSFCVLLKTQLRPCPKHPKMVTSSWHMKYHHHCYIKPVTQIWRDDIKPLVHPKIKRDLITSSLVGIIDGYIDKYKYYLSQLEKSNKFKYIQTS